MNNITPEQFEALVRQVQNNSGSVSLIFTGILAAVGLISLMIWIMNFRLKPLEALIPQVAEIQKTVQEIYIKMWKPESLNDRIANVVSDDIKEHEKTCPARKCYIHAKTDEQ